MVNVFVVVVTSDDEDVSEEDACNSISYLNTGNKQSMWIDGIFKENKN